MRTRRFGLRRAVSYADTAVVRDRGVDARVIELPEHGAVVPLHRLGHAPVARDAGIGGRVQKPQAYGFMNPGGFRDDEPGPTPGPRLVVGHEAVIGQLIRTGELGTVPGREDAVSEGARPYGERREEMFEGHGNVLPMAWSGPTAMRSRTVARLSGSSAPTSTFR